MDKWLGDFKYYRFKLTNHEEGKLRESIALNNCN
jgi:hypothetical protein